MEAITKTNFSFHGQINKYEGKVRDVYNINNEYLAIVVTDRVSAFDFVFPKGIPFKGQVLNQVASLFLDKTQDIVPNWKLVTPDPMVTIGRRCEPFKVEMVVRGYICGSAWRLYQNGSREICGVKLKDGLKENERFVSPIITPTTKADIGHDENISKEEIIRQGLVSKKDYEQLEDYTLKLFKRGTDIAKEQGLILVDTKYEFGKVGDKIFLIDEIHTPDSSRYFYSEGYEERFIRGEKQRQLSKEFLREWLMQNGFSGKTGEKMPELTDEIVKNVSQRYIELFEHITGNNFIKPETNGNVLERIENNITKALNSL
ncbi:MAG: phosphoribosylaminoimidazolesuccinocarboxamide synthase [Bacteroidales bacterium]|jgi:phosphoribosylaminoimidazole-succinocarboxamide synthase|nr:phosphoribosylaminoimidazolesuccinocarboxamide synthase [Bacteroidales bacterium]